jgi:hypothetical protein
LEGRARDRVVLARVFAADWGNEFSMINFQGSRKFQ